MEQKTNELKESYLNELTHEQVKIRVKVTIKELDEPKEVTTRNGSKLTVQHCKVVDSKGNEGYLALWNDQIGLYKENNLVELINGYSKIYDGNVNISSGKTGIIRKLNQVIA